MTPCLLACLLFHFLHPPTPLFPHSLPPPPPKTVDCVASCELQLSELWRQGHSSSAAATTSAGGGDIISREFTLVPAAEKAGAYTVSGCVGSLRLTLVAARALKTLRLGLQAGL